MSKQKIIEEFKKKYIMLEDGSNWDRLDKYGKVVLYGEEVVFLLQFLSKALDTIREETLEEVEKKIDKMDGSLVEDGLGGNEYYISKDDAKYAINKLKTKHD